MSRSRRLGFGVLALVLLSLSLLVSGCRLRKVPTKDEGSEASQTPVRAQLGQGGARSSDSEANEKPAEKSGPSDLTQDMAPQARAGSEESGGLDEGAEPLDGTATPKTALRKGYRAYVYAGGVELTKSQRKRLDQVAFSEDAAETATLLVRELERLPSTNAGFGSALRLDGETVECAAVLSDGDGRMAEVSGLRKVREPSLVAHALYRAGGGKIVGPAGDELAERLGLSLTSLVTEDSRRLYGEDLALALKEGKSGKLGSLFNLYVSQEQITTALSAPRRTGKRDAPRDAVFALVYAPGGSRALALSTGGRSLALPGEAFELYQTVRFSSLPSGEAFVGVVRETPCEFEAELAVKLLSQTQSSLLVTSAFERECPSGAHLLVTESELKTDLSAESLYVSVERAEESKGSESASSEESPPLPAVSSSAVIPRKTSPPSASLKPPVSGPARPSPPPAPSPAPQPAPARGSSPVPAGTAAPQAAPVRPAAPSPQKETP